MEEELLQTPTKDIAAQLLEHSAILFKTADCSKSVKGTLVHKMKDTVTLMRAATSVLTRQMREETTNPELAEIRRDLDRLRQENRELKEELECLKSAPRASTNTSLLPEGSAAKTRYKRPRIENSEEEEGMETSPHSEKASHPLLSLLLFLSQSGGKRERGGEYEGCRPFIIEDGTCEVWPLY